MVKLNAMEKGKRGKGEKGNPLCPSSPLPLFLFLLLLPLTADAYQPVIFKRRPTAAATVCSNNVASPLLYEGFENPTGYDRSGWAEDIGPGGGIDEDYAATILYGTQSLLVTVPNDDQSYTTNSFTAQDRVWVAFLLRPTSVPDPDTRLFRLTDASGNCQFSFSLNSDGTQKEVRFQFGCTGTAYQPAATMVVDTTYWVFIEYWNDNGANAYASVAFSTNGTRPTSGDNFIEATGTSTATQVSQVMLGRPASENGTEIVFIFDHLFIDDEQLPDCPYYQEEN